MIYLHSLLAYGRQYQSGLLLAGIFLFALAHFAFASCIDGHAGTFRTSASEVRVTFFATDSANRALVNLDKDDFAIVDGDTVVREFRSLSRSEELALDVVVLVDASESVATHLQTTITDVLQLVSQKRTISDDRISLVSFAGAQPPVVLCAYDCTGSSDRLLSVKAAGSTPLFDALSFGVTFLSRGKNEKARPIIVLFSDGDDTESKLSASDALGALVDSGVLLYAVDLNPHGEQPSHGSATLQKLAAASGGRYFTGVESVASVLQAAFEDLRASYIVTYQLPTLAVGFHSLRVLPKHNLNLRFHSRNGYYYGTSVP